MPNLSHSAGLPGAPRCSEATTGTKPRGSRRAAPALVKRQLLGLSFFSITETVDGKRVASCAFDVEPQEYGAGNLTGYRAAAELFSMLDTAPDVLGADVALQAVLREVFAILRAESSPTGHVDRHGAAVTFMIAIRQAVLSAAGHFDMSAWCRAEADRQQQSAQRRALAEETRNQATGARIRAAKAAKRAARLADQAANQASGS